MPQVANILAKLDSKKKRIKRNLKQVGFQISQGQYLSTFRETRFKCLHQNSNRSSEKN